MLSQTIEPPGTLKIILLEEAGRTVGFAPVVRHPGHIGFFRVSDLPLLYRRVERYDMLGEPLIGACRSKEQQMLHIADMFRTLREDMPPRSAIFIFGVPHESALHDAVRQKSLIWEDFHVVPYGPPYHRRLISFTGDYEDYLRSLGKITRKDLRRTRRKVLSALGGELEMRAFRTPTEVETFLSEATAISRKTYQWNLYGAGLRDEERVLRRMKAAAEYGWFRSYILYVENRPAAFQVGHPYRGTYYACETGYDPGWSKLQIGIFLLTEIFLDLTDIPETVSRFDFLHGDDLHKSRLSNTARVEQDYYLFPRGIRGAMLAYPLKASLKLSASMAHVADRFRLKRGIKRFLRRASAPKCAKSPPK